MFHATEVDMFYFPLFDGCIPDWSPLWAGDHFVFFRPVFNPADAAITCGVVLLILTHRSPRKVEQQTITPVEPSIPEPAPPGSLS